MEETKDISALISPRIDKIIKLAKAGKFNSALEDYHYVCEYSKCHPELVNLKKLLESLRQTYMPSYLQKKPATRAQYLGRRLETVFYIVTPSFNAVDTIEETIESVINQEGHFTLNYHVQDGGSTDGTIQILRKWKKKLSPCASRQSGRTIHFTYDTGPDEGMYDAIIQGFTKLHSKESQQMCWMGWINSDDQIDAGALNFLADIDNSEKSTLVNWITGIPSVRRENGVHDSFRVPISSELISKGLCDGNHWWFLQQEGTFWRKKLWDECGAERVLKEHKLAGDWRLWFEFSKKHTVHQALRPLGIFNFRNGQLSQTSLGKYKQEIDAIVPNDVRKCGFNSLKGSSLQVSEVIRVDSSGQIIVSKREVGIKSEKEIALEVGPKVKPVDPDTLLRPVLDPYFLHTYGVSESSKKEKLGIIVFAHTRDKHLEAVLNSLKSQNAASITNVWIDGHQGKQALIEKTQRVADVAKKYCVGKITRHNGQLGFRKMLIQGLMDMANRYESVIVLEDDCYPTEEAVRIFSEELENIAKDPDTFSIYGHYFQTPSEGKYIARFQGWGWATTSVKLRPILHQLIDCYSMTEEKFLEFVSLTLTEEVKQIIDVTPPRNPSVCLEKFFAWDETVALLTGLMGLRHKKAQKRIIYNIGMDEGEHFIDNPIFRAPPFNMLTLSEVQNLDT